MAHSSHIRWYNPKLANFEWREVPHSDEEASELLDGYPVCAPYAVVYGEWRNLGSSITTALIRAAKEDRDDARGC
jgi:hypothetical protein